MAIRNDARSVERWKASERIERELERTPKISSIMKKVATRMEATFSRLMCVGG